MHDLHALVYFTRGGYRVGGRKGGGEKRRKRGRETGEGQGRKRRGGRKG